METPPNNQPLPAKRYGVMVAQVIELMPPAKRAEVDELNLLLSNKGNNAPSDWQNWVLGFYGRVLDLMQEFPNYALSISNLLVNTTKETAFSDLLKPYVGRVIANYEEFRENNTEMVEKYARTHPLLLASEAPALSTSPDDYYFYLTRRTQLLALIGLYELLTNPGASREPTTAKVVRLPQDWLDYINERPLFRIEGWLPASFFVSQYTDILAAPQQAPTPPPQPPAAGAVTLAVGRLSPAELILGPGFTLSEATRLARAVGITDEAGRYCLGGRKYGAVVGFCLALKIAGKLQGTVPELTAVVGPLLGVEIKTRKNNALARRYEALTEKALKTPKPTA